MNCNVNLIIEDDRWLHDNDSDFWQMHFNKIFKLICGDEDIVKSSFETEIDFSEIENSHIEINLLLTNDEAITELNEKFRYKNTATNVLSFPQHENICNIDTIFRQDEILLGDIAMSFETIMRESNEVVVDFFDRCLHLFAHGVLHTLGMDHISDDDAKKMENTEANILKLVNIKNPYI